MQAQGELVAMKSASLPDMLVFAFAPYRSPIVPTGIRCESKSTSENDSHKDVVTHRRASQALS